MLENVRPAIGGYLSRPTEQFPDVFGQNQFLKDYPYFLACAVPATFSALAWLVTMFFLKEVILSTFMTRESMLTRLSI